MNIWTTFRNGLATVLRLRKIAGLIYLLNLLTAAVVTLPLFILFHQKIGLLPARGEMSTGFSYSWWSAFNFSADGLEKTIRPSLSGGFGPLFDNIEMLFTGNWAAFGWAVFVLGILYIFLSAFLNGGAVALFVEDKPFSMQRFFSQAGLYFHHMAALTVTLISLFWIIYKGLYPLVFSLVDKITAGSLSQPFIWIINFIGYVVIIKVVFIVTLIFDYARVILIIEKKSSSWQCIGQATLFVFRNFRSFALNALLVLIAVLLTIIAGLLFSVVHSTTVFLLVLLVLLQQIFMLMQIGMRLTFYASETLFYEHQTEAVQPIRRRKR
jgi:hypothetical protein